MPLNFKVDICQILYKIFRFKLPPGSSVIDFHHPLGYTYVCPAGNEYRYQLIDIIPITSQMPFNTWKSRWTARLFVNCPNVYTRAASIRLKFCYFNMHSVLWAGGQTAIFELPPDPRPMSNCPCSDVEKPFRLGGPLFNSIALYVLHIKRVA